MHTPHTTPHTQHPTPHHIPHTTTHHAPHTTSTSLHLITPPLPLPSTDIHDTTFTLHTTNSFLDCICVYITPFIYPPCHSFLPPHPHQSPLNLTPHPSPVTYRLYVTPSLLTSRSSLAPLPSLHPPLHPHSSLLISHPSPLPLPLPLPLLPHILPSMGPKAIPSHPH